MHVQYAYIPNKVFSLILIFFHLYEVFFSMFGIFTFPHFYTYTGHTQKIPDDDDNNIIIIMQMLQSILQMQAFPLIEPHTILMVGVAM